MILRFLAFLRLVDLEDGRLSLTNIALIVLLGKLCLLKTVDLPDLAAFFLALLAYSYKKHLVSQKNTAEEESPPGFDAQGALSALTSKVKDLEVFVSTVKLGGGLGGRR